MGTRGIVDPFALSGYPRRRAGHVALGMLSVLYAHVVFVTRDRLPLIDATVAECLSDYLVRVAGQEGVHLLALGMVTTHVHLVIRYRPTVSIPWVLQRLKGGSAHVVSRRVLRPLRWAKGYSIHSVGPRGVPAAVAYVLSQPERHPDQRIPDWPRATG